MSNRNGYVFDILKRKPNKFYIVVKQNKFHLQSYTVQTNLTFFAQLIAENKWNPHFLVDINKEPVLFPLPEL